MKKSATILILALFTILSCKTKTKVLEGDLYFKLIDFGTFYGVKKDKVKKFEKMIDSLRLSKTSSKNDQEFIEYYDKLKKHKLLNYPCIKIKSDSIIRQIYLTESEYNKVKDYSWSDLRTRKKKVKIIIEIQEIDKDIYFSNKIVNFNEVHGQTYWKK